MEKSSLSRTNVTEIGGRDAPASKVTTVAASKEPLSKLGEHTTCSEPRRINRSRIARAGSGAAGRSEPSDGKEAGEML
jgi:hypothetical protein